MRSARLVTVAAATAAVLILGSAPVGADDPPQPDTTVTVPAADGPEGPAPPEPPATPALTLAIDPTSGPVGTDIGLSGDGCAGDLVWYGLFFGATEAEAAIVDLWWANPAADGTWSGDLVVYDTMVRYSELDKAQPATVPVEPGDGYFAGAFCEYYPDEFGDIDDPEQLGDNGPFPDETTFSDEVRFEVTGGGEAPRTEPLPSAPGLEGLTPQAPTTEVVTAPALPATAVVATPSYTG